MLNGLNSELKELNTMPKYVMRRTTGDVWMQINTGKWQKVHRGINTKITSKPIGYIGYGFFPHNKPGKYRPVEKHTGAFKSWYD